MIRIALIVPGTLLRRGLEAVLEELPDIDIVSSSATLPERFTGDAVDVLVVSGSETGGQALIEGLPSLDHLPAVLLLGDDPVGLRGWVDLPFRAIGALPSEAGEEELYAAISALEKGLSVWHPQLRDGMRVWDAPEDDRADGSPPDLVEPLTDRELEVLQLLALGSANKRIALALGISEHTVKFHISSIYGKLSAGNRTEAVRIGLQTGLISI
jgi:DNA-binding NarL/FixJ family response regulator